MRRRSFSQLCSVCVVMLATIGIIGCHSGTPAQGPGQQRIGPDGQTLVWVPSGSFMMGSDDGPDDERPIHRVTLDGFWIGRCEVTNAQYRAFCNATGREFPASSNQGDDHPVGAVNWYDAQAYCAFYGYTLPTEAQWEYAARGPSVPTYPWGDEWDAQKCCNWANLGPGDRTFPVGSFPAGASWCGALDMAGNVWEWCADWYSETYYQVSPEWNPPGPESGESRVVRGDSWWSEDPRVAQRFDLPSGAEGNSFGFRVSTNVP